MWVKTEHWPVHPRSILDGFIIAVFSLIVKSWKQETFYNLFSLAPHGAQYLASVQIAQLLGVLRAVGGNRHMHQGQRGIGTDDGPGVAMPRGQAALGPRRGVHQQRLQHPSLFGRLTGDINLAMRGMLQE